MTPSDVLGQVDFQNLVFKLNLKYLKYMSMEYIKYFHLQPTCIYHFQDSPALSSPPVISSRSVDQVLRPRIPEYADVQRRLASFSNWIPARPTPRDMAAAGFFYESTNEWKIAKTHMHDDVIKWKHFPRYWPFVRGIHWSLVNSHHKGQWRGALMFSLKCTWTIGWANNRDAPGLRRLGAHYDVTIISWYPLNNT